MVLEAYLGRSAHIIRLLSLDDGRSVILQQPQRPQIRPFDRDVARLVRVRTLIDDHHEIPFISERLRLPAARHPTPARFAAPVGVEPFPLCICQQDLPLIGRPKHVYTESLSNLSGEGAAMGRPAGAIVIGPLSGRPVSQLTCSFASQRDSTSMPSSTVSSRCPADEIGPQQEDSAAVPFVPGVTSTNSAARFQTTRPDMLDLPELP